MDSRKNLVQQFDDYTNAMLDWLREINTAKTKSDRQAILEDMLLDLTAMEAKIRPRLRIADKTINSIRMLADELAMKDLGENI